MTASAFDIIPVAQREVARAALAKVSEGAVIDRIAPVMGGVSGASVFRVDVCGRICVLRIEGPPSPLRNPHQYQSMRIAAEAGVAPALRFVDEQTGVAIMDFISARPLATYPGGPPALAQAVGALLARVQATPLFPHFIEYPQIVSRLWTHVCRTGLFAPGVLDRPTQHLSDVCKAYAWDRSHCVSSHNDLLPRNLLFDGTRLWLIDWESAYRNDPLVDVATALDNFAPTPELQAVLLEAWRGHEPEPSVLARLTHVRALTRLYYAGVLFSASAAAQWRVSDDNLEAPSPAEFEAAVRAGRLRPDTAETTHILGKMYLASFLTGGPAPGLPPAFSHFRI